jgi:hypothetical protein
MTLTRTHLFGFLGLVALAFGLYWAKAEAQAVREQVLVLQQDVDAERRAVRTLEAELAWVERPDRLEAASAKLGLEPVGAERIADLNLLDEIAPVHGASSAQPSAALTENPAKPALAAPPTRQSQKGEAGAKPAAVQKTEGEPANIMVGR